MKDPKIAHRYSKARIRIVDSEGRPVAGKKVSFEQKTHEFLFGSGAFDAVPYCTAIDPTAISFFTDKKEIDKDFYKDRVDKWVNLFNYGTLPFYWGGYEPKEGDVQYISRMNAAKYLVERGKTLKGHPLCWHTACADWLMEYDNKTIMKKQLDRIYRDVSAFKGVIDKWDVINETCIMPIYDRYDNAITRICNEYGRLELIKMVFDAAHETNPDAQLLINDFNLSDEYAHIIADSLDKGTPIHAIGIQTHQHQGYKGMEWLESVLARFEKFGLPMHFTENTLVSGDIMPADIVDLNDYQVDEWPSTPEGEERQAREWKEMYVRLFEHPLVEAITGWDFADGMWLHAPSGVIREDNTVKPAYNVLYDLINNVWHTSETYETDAEGFVVVEGFRGAYEITCEGKAATYNLSKASKDGETVKL